ncbi:MAG: hypothetical protein EBS19_03530 [Spirochaetia bacterium]|nr:hypothetical protein [Spirochaetia bacterium]
MKKSMSFLLASISLFLFAIGCSKGTNKDFKTGLSYNYNGFSVSEVLLAGPDNIAMKSNEVQMNTSVAIVIQGLENYTLKDDKAFPGMMLTVSNKNGEEVIHNDDLFADTEGYSATDASILRGTFPIGEPMVIGETYHVKMRVWDKNKKETELNAEVDLLVK